VTRDLACLGAEAQEAYARMVTILRDQRGWEENVEYRRQNTCRTVDDQLALAAQGRSELMGLKIDMEWAKAALVEIKELVRQHL
jgi:hypothetical protein